jgi:two-component system chemotaxis response regulator CheY
MKKILIVDDSSFLRLILKNIFKKYQLFEAKSGEEALKVFRENKPDIILLDIVMPGLDGKEALRELRKLDPKAQVIMVTAVGQNATMDECRKLGAIDYVTKPFDEEAVLQTVEQYLGES